MVGNQKLELMIRGNMSPCPGIISYRKCLKEVMKRSLISTQREFDGACKMLRCLCNKTKTKYLFFHFQIHSFNRCFFQHQKRSTCFLFVISYSELLIVLFFHSPWFHYIFNGLCFMDLLFSLTVSQDDDGRHLGVAQKFALQNISINQIGLF